MNKATLDLIIENSIKAKIQELVPMSEATTGSDIAPTDRIVGELIKEVYPSSLPSQVCSVQPLTGPEGHIISIGRKRDSNGNVIKGAGSGIETHKTLITVDDHILETDFTIEFVQDMIHLYGENGYEFIASWLKNTLIEDMNSELITKIKACAASKGTIKPETATDFDGGTHSILAFAQRLYGEIMSKTNRFFNPFIIATPRVGMMLTLGTDTVERTDAKNYLGTVANIKIYIDHEATTDFVIVGHQGKEPGDAGYIFSPYVTQIYEATSPITGEMKIFVNSRYELTKNPADKDTSGTNSDFFAKFNVDLSGVAAYGITA